ncbi:argininosuccinate synthase-related protein [Streptomyces sp. CBMA123]|uniref:argininosuccinate synthase-related protein n=1 Tax=Streptomyces sp. CBMA123 TaxID=1896313 RepID=UPI0016618E56|nr:argininosuccinate synthase-related protein [Streptomyces sp. CBMA123]MBD0695426.1 argininosuccinate synthase [Streptomyces sp. CBMA123]
MQRRHRLIRSFRHLTTDALPADAPVVTLFSGGLDSSFLLLRLKNAGFREVHALSVDLGEDETSEQKRQIADELGVRLHIVDGRQAFADEFVRAAVISQAVYLGTHPVSSTLSRPLIARFAVELARRLGASAVLHTANRSQNTMRRLNGALELLGFDGAYGSPYDLDPVSREVKSQELKEAGLAQMSERVVSGDSNLWCREFESGILDDPEQHAVPEQMFRWSARRPGAVEDGIEVRFEGGTPVAVDGVELPLVRLIGELNRRVGAFGLGRYSGLEHLGGGEKVLEIREMPAAWLLLRSYRHLETAVLSAETIREKMHLEQVWLREGLEGRWFGELRAAAQSFMDFCARPVTGSVRWRLTPGGAETRSITADRPLYLRDREAWEQESVRSELSALAGA